MTDLDIPVFEGNSHKGREQREAAREKPLLTPVVSKKPIKTEKKWSLIDCLYKDPNKTFKEFVVKDLVIPNTKRAIGTVLQGIVTTLFGTGFGNAFGGAYTFTNNWWGTNRSTAFQSQNPTVSSIPQNKQPQPQATTDLQSYVLQTKDDAERVLEGLGSYIESYDVVPVSAFFELIGVQAPYTYHDFGWTSLGGVKIVPVQNGWSINFPRPVRIR